MVIPPNLRRPYVVHDGEADISAGFLGCRLPLQIVADMAKVNRLLAEGWPRWCGAEMGAFIPLADD